MQLQEVMVQGMWGNEILALPHCAAELTEEGELLYFGPRVRIGMCEGVPTAVTCVPPGINSCELGPV